MTVFCHSFHCRTLAAQLLGKGGSFFHTGICQINSEGDVTIHTYDGSHKKDVFSFTYYVLDGEIVIHRYVSGLHVDICRMRLGVFPCHSESSSARSVAKSVCSTVKSVRSVVQRVVVSS